VGKKANIFKARYLHGNGGRRCGRHKCEGHAFYPGRSDILPRRLWLCEPRGEQMGCQKSAAAILALSPQSEGPNITERE
jgi:hypothetical protein